ncbi:MAG: alpha/beta hydrolase [Promicromonosporaceae bacterium]|nr:alpha/beta hydrolase [Promicromonosporaceae bacterium]
MEMHQTHTTKSHDQTQRTPRRAQMSDPKVEVGILVVHGIGEPEAGATLAGVVNTVRLAADLEGGVLSKANVADGDDTTSSTFNLKRDGLTLHFEEANWVSSLTHRSSWVVWMRLLGVVPVLPLLAAVSWSRRYESHHPEEEEASSEHVLSVLIAPFKEFTPHITVLFASLALFFPLLVACLIMLLIYPLLKIVAGGSSFVSRIDVLLVKYFGNVLGYVGDADGDVIVSEICERIREMRNKHGRVVVVAHSQGADISRRALLRVPEVDGFISVASGESQLGLLRTIEMTRWLIVFLWFFATATPVYVAWIASLMISDVRFFIGSFVSIVRDHDLLQWPDMLMQLTYSMLWDWGTWGQLLVACLAAVIMMFVLSRAVRRPPDVERWPDCPTVFVRSAFDPVSFGVGLAHQSVVTIPRGSLCEVLDLSEHRKRFWETPHAGAAIVMLADGESQINVSSGQNVSRKRRWLVTFLILAAAFSLLYCVGNQTLNLL